MFATRYHERVGTARFAVGFLALASCAGAARPGREQRVPSALPTAAVVDVTSAWDAEPPAGRPGEPLVALNAQWAVKDALPLREMDARVVVQGPLALTELHLVFENTTDHLIEANPNKLVVPSWARFELRLPPGSAVARFAHEQLDRWHEAEMVAVSHEVNPCLGWWAPKAPPDVTAESPGHPARFAANVEPIQPHARKTVLVAFTQALVAPGEPYRLPLLGLPRLDRFDAVVRFPLDPRMKAVRVHKQGWTPDRDWVVDAPPAQPSAIRSGRFVVARIARPVDAADAEPAGHIAFLVDTSASRGERLRADAEKVAGVLKELSRTAPQARVDVAAFDQNVQSIYTGAPAGFGAPELGRLVARGALGATDLGAALRWAAQQRVDRVVLLSDGVPTLGGRTSTELAADLDALRAAGARRLDATTSPNEHAVELLRSLASGLEKRGVILAPEEAPASIVARLGRATVEPIEVPGAVWSWPRETPAGAPVVVFAELAPGKPLDVRLSGRSVPLEAREVVSPLVDHEAARADVDRLQSAPASPTDADPTRAPLAELSTRYRVLSRESRWVVPESEQQYVQLGVDRTTTPVLGVGATDVEANPRPPLQVLPAKRAECRPGPVETNRHFSDLVGRSWVVPTRVLLEKGREGFSAVELGALKDKLKEVLFQRNPAAKSLEVEGYCNEHGVEAENLRVARARAVALRDALLKIGVDARARAYGSLPPPVGFFEYGWSDGAGPLNAQKKPSAGDAAFGRVGPERPAVGDPSRGEAVVRLVIKEPTKDPKQAASPLAGKLAEVLSASDRSAAEAWLAAAPSDPMAALGVGLTRDSAGDSKGAARAFGSLLDLAPGSSSAGRSAAAFLEKEDPTRALEVLEETGSLEADQTMMSRWALGLALARAGRLEESVDALASTLDAWMRVRSLNNGDMSDFRELQRVFLHAPSTLDVLEHELSIVAAAAARAHPDKKSDILARLAPYGIELATRPSLRFVLTWESDADVDLQVESGGRRWDPVASVTRDALPGEGLVLDDVRSFGPEEYVVSGAARAYPYRALAHLHGPAANVLGRVDVLDYDGSGHLTVEQRPFVVQAEGGTADVITVRAPL
jgi:hypothetical protein